MESRGETKAHDGGKRKEAHSPLDDEIGVEFEKNKSGGQQTVEGLQGRKRAVQPRKGSRES
jgi:hypothetical protein